MGEYRVLELAPCSAVGKSSGMRPHTETPAPGHHPEAIMRVRFSIPAMLSTLLAAAACDSSPAGSFDQSPAALLAVAPSVVTLKSGAKFQLTLTAQNDQGQPAAASGVVWTTSNPRVATVAPDGVVTGFAKGGALITASWSGVHGASSITVIGETAAPEPCSTGTTRPEISLKKICILR